LNEFPNMLEIVDSLKFKNLIRKQYIGIIYGLLYPKKLRKKLIDKELMVDFSSGNCYKVEAPVLSDFPISNQQSFNIKEYYIILHLLLFKTNILLIWKIFCFNFIVNKVLKALNVTLYIKIINHVNNL
ncbi:hypothetical protein C1645_698209, partial [Glomus cerebriforme]